MKDRMYGVIDKMSYTTGYNKNLKTQPYGCFFHELD